ncbi:hypothetical protein PUNSTDRAFT_140920 [Punctularia strigosozonata HHB-11173 SS5]|uniref:uncharacterized protein n=1 Tax=Punctularia strigosozonata (strain HHB-11173) TaxID=741275 RepID=UPI000441630C|nr:uncharacterized protein PUNSTDRAFT_140920 [Punctularia strigosozonata HHB-11173 SS5]EIN14692.1 hypothetical protein PUNSTDRAFT_140920 [Punctularia strigosozonata HHB-11173 SS5]
MLFKSVFVLFAAAATFGVNAAPLEVRQIGNLECNINRFQIVTDLSSAKTAVGKLGAAAPIASNTTAAAAVQAVTDGISGAQGAIGVIGKALLKLQAAPAEARDQVQGNLTSAQNALDSITPASVSSNDTSTLGLLSDAQSKLNDAITAGLNVVANCK